MKKEVRLWEMEKAINSGEYYTSLRNAGQSVVAKGTVPLAKGPSAIEVDDGVIYWETDYNLFCRAYNLDPKTGNCAGKGTTIESKGTVPLSKGTKLEIKELAKTMAHKDVAVKYGISRRYVSKLAFTNA